LTQLGLNPECKWTEVHLAQKLGVTLQTINSWISDIRTRQRANRNVTIIRLSRLGWSQEQIAKVVGLDRSAVSRIEQNIKIGEMHNLLAQGPDMDYIALLKASGWEITHIIDCPMSTQRFQANIVAQMQKNRTLGIVRRSLIIGRKK